MSLSSGHKTSNPAVLVALREMRIAKTNTLVCMLLSFTLGCPSTQSMTYHFDLRRANIRQIKFTFGVYKLSAKFLRLFYQLLTVTEPYLGSYFRSERSKTTVLKLNFSKWVKAQEAFYSCLKVKHKEKFFACVNYFLTCFISCFHVT